jgi:hypothetical protein
MKNNAFSSQGVFRVVIFAVFSAQAACRGMGGLIDRWETSNGTFRVRVSTYAERGAFVGGMYYKVEASANDHNWIHVMTLRDDDQRPIPHDQIKFLSATVAYVFIGWTYAATTDGGRKWSIWNAKDDLPDWQCCNYKLITSVDLHSNGSGTMTLNPKAHFRGGVPELHTIDFGQHWTR